jgi:arginase
VSELRWQLTGVPYTSMRQPGGIARAITVLRERQLGNRLAALGVEDTGDLQLLEPTGERGPSGLLNEEALMRLIEATGERVIAAHEGGRLPLLVGGDCPVLLGALAALREGDLQPGLIMLDGHEDAWPPPASDTGEGSDSEIAIALAEVSDLPESLERRLPLLSGSDLAYVGPRDQEELSTAGVSSLRDRVAYFADAEQASAELAAGRDPAGDALRAIAVDSFWLHIDLDVLATPAFAAVDYRQPGGLDWGELDRLAATVVGERGCRGVSVVIYNPDLDPERVEADKLVSFLSRLVQDRR